jgi:hypothetical protein
LKKTVFLTLFVFMMCYGMNVLSFMLPEESGSQSCREVSEIPADNTISRSYSCPNVFTVYDSTGRSSTAPLIRDDLNDFIRCTFIDDCLHTREVIAYAYTIDKLPRLFAKELLQIQSPKDCQLYVRICYSFFNLIKKCNITFQNMELKDKDYWIREIGRAMCFSENMLKFLEKHSPPNTVKDAIKSTHSVIMCDDLSSVIHISKEKVLNLLHRIDRIDQMQSSTVATGFEFSIEE